MNAQAQSVLDFWFADSGGARPEWFRKDLDFDREIAARFGALIEQALSGGLRQWDSESPQAGLAHILLLDQFTRNVFRGMARAFAGDALALNAAQDFVDADEDLALSPWQRAFVYMPFEHAESDAAKAQAVALFTRLAGGGPEFDSMLDYARRHRDIIVRFGRFPHRNQILGRASTPEELAFLARPGSGF